MPRLLLSLWCFALLACSRPASEPGPPPPSGPPAQRAFYFWRTTFRLSAVEQEALRALQIERVYVRMFDVVWQGGAAATVGAIAPTPGQVLPPALELVPVVFLREEVLRRLPAGERAALATSLWQQVQDRAKALGFEPRELQLDCDWTDGSRDAFFALLERLREVAQIPLSATIRLHQVKYRERTGVPPVARGMLMFYNMGRFSADPEARAIFDAAAASRYLSRVATYPLPLDVALPIWSWTLHLRGERVLDVLQSTDPDELPQVALLERVAEGRYRARASGFLHGVLLRQGDELKVERTDAPQAAAAAAMIAPHLSPHGASSGAGARRTLALFDLSERNLTRHGTLSLAHLFQSVR